MKPWYAAYAGLGLLLVSTAAVAVPPGPLLWAEPDLMNVAPEASAGGGVLPFEKLTPAEQLLLRRYAQRWANLPPQRREALVQGARRWLAATPEERRRWRAFFHHWRTLPPAKQERLRQRWETLGPEERERLRDWLRFGRPPGRSAPPDARPPVPPPSLDREV